MWFGAALVFLFILFSSIFFLMQIDVFLRVLLFCFAQSRLPFYYLRRNVHVIGNISVVSHIGCKLIDIWIYSIFTPVRIVFEKISSSSFCEMFHLLCIGFSFNLLTIVTWWMQLFSIQSFSFCICCFYSPSLFMICNTLTAVKASNLWKDQLNPKNALHTHTHTHLENHSIGKSHKMKNKKKERTNQIKKLQKATWTENVLCDVM